MIDARENLLFVVQINQTGEEMMKKMIVGVLLAASCIFVLPAAGSAAEAGETTIAESSTIAEYSIQRRNRRNRMRNRRVRIIRQVYYRNGRRYVRYYRVRR